MNGHNITNESLALSMVLVLIAILVSYREKLALEKDIIWSICRAIVQLIIVGYVLKYIFNVNHAVLTLLMVLFICFNAAWNAKKRSKYIDKAFIDEPVVRFADLEVNIPARRILRGSEEIHLTPIEFRLLAALLNNPGKVLTQRQLLNQVWGPNAVEHSHYLRIYMGHLRQKLEADPARPQHLLTETGIGYRFMP